jgi:hypothetical protein
MGQPPDLPEATRTADHLRWRVRVRPGVHEEAITGSPNFLSWCDELGGIRLACPRCGRHKAVVRRWTPAGCRTVYWLLCISVIDRKANCLSEEVLREVLTEARGAEVACSLLGRSHGPTG